MKSKIVKVVFTAAWAITGIALIVMYGTRAIALATLGQICIVGLIILDLLGDDEGESESERNSCRGCIHDLGGGRCRMNVELECREGGGFEMWEDDE